MDVQIRDSLYNFSIVTCQLALRLPNGKRESGEIDIVLIDAICPILISKRVLLASSIELMFLLLGRAKLVKGQGQSKAGERSGQSKPGERSSSTGTPSISKSITSLEAMGVRVFGLDEPLVGNAKEEVSWDTIAGYDQQKRYLKCGALTVNYF
ncbi:uncharacterized protein LOC110681745 [Chenopodium quinoa]|uniref:uncharacterized protein LOC110681745 n=1 Tax=Chenopodium quinoa TaxID=63459 RepID=UPI000B77A23E|nr:uncharacterized protein LOC110681745 [Chenopodium quinoa]